MRRKTAILGLLATALVSTMFAAEGRVPEGIPNLDHVFVIVMENHGFSQIIGNPDAPFANQYAKSANSATNYFAVGHPSSTNYLEIVGGSNFGVRSDNSPDWHNQNCSPNLGPTPYLTTDFPSSPNVCPIAGTGTDAATPAVDFTNECPNPTVTDPCAPGLISIDGSSIPAASNTVGKTIGDQLAEHGRRWKSYQESLPPTGADNVNYSDGFFTDLSTIPTSLGGSNAFLKLYAAKHNPFVYFKSVQEGNDPNNSLANVVGFEGKGGLYDDLNSGRLPVAVVHRAQPVQRSARTRQRRRAVRLRLAGRWLASRTEPGADLYRRPHLKDDRIGDPQLSRVAKWTQRDRRSVGRKRLQLCAQPEPGAGDRGYQLRPPRFEEWALLHSLLAD